MRLQNPNNKTDSKLWQRISICFLISLIIVNTTFGQTKDESKPELIVQTGHTNSVASASFSPDKKNLASASYDNTIKIWNIETGQQIKSLEGHDGPVFKVVYSPDGKMLASGSSDGTIKLWGVETGQLIRSLEGHSGYIESVAFSPDAKTLASGGEDKTIRLWNVETGQQIESLEGHTLWVESVAFSLDGRILISGSSDKTIKIWNVKTGQQIKSLEGHTSGVNSVAFSPDGKTLASASRDKTIRVWNIGTGKQIKLLEGHADLVHSIAYSLDGKTLVSGSDDKTIKLWNIETGRQLKSFGEDIKSFVAYSSDGKTIASTNDNHAIKLWNIETGQQIKTLESRANYVSSVAFSPNGKFFAIVNERDIKLWHVETGQQIKSFKGHTDFVFSVAFSLDGKFLASGSGDKTIRLWNTETGQQIKSLDGHINLISSVSFSPDQKTLISASFDRTIKLWDIKTGQQIRSFEGHTSLVEMARVSPNGKILASGSRDKTIKLWNIETGEQINTLNGHTDWVYSIVFSPDGKTLASGSHDRTIRLWSVETGRQIKSFDGHSAMVKSVEFSPDGRTLISGSYDTTVKRWDVKTGSQIRSFEDHTAGINSVSYSPDNKFFVSGSQDGTVKLWDTQSSKPLATLISVGTDDWIVITPEGLFDGSPNAWKLLLWRITPQLHDVVPVEAFFKEFYRPGLLQDIFNGNPIEPPTQDLTKIDIRQPLIKISAIDGKEVDSSALLPDEISAEKKSIKVKVEITDNTSEPRSGIAKNTSSDARDVRLFRNGSLVKLWNDNAFKLTEKDGCKQFPASGNSPRKAVCETDVQITSGKNELTVYGFNRENVKSSDHTAIVNGAESLKRDGTLYILAVGVNEYANRAFNLKYAVPDVEAIGKELTLQQSKLSAKPYAETKVITLTDKQATKANFVNALKRFSGTNAQSGAVNAELEKIKPIQPEDALIIYFAGHGLASKDRFYLIPHDGIPADFSKSITDSSEQQRLLTQGQSLSDQKGLEQLFKQSLSDLELEDLLETVNAGKLMMVIDACNSGQALEAEEKRRGPMNSRGLAQLAYEKGMNILTASQSFQAAIEASSLNHGLLTYALLEGLKNGDKNNDQMIIDREWLDFGVITVPRLQIEARNKRLLIQNKPTNTANNDANLQTPRVFYRRESDVKPMIIASP